MRVIVDIAKLFVQRFNVYVRSPHCQRFVSLQYRALSLLFCSLVIKGSLLVSSTFHNIKCKYR